jgi:hypothetical protein
MVNGCFTFRRSPRVLYFRQAEYLNYEKVVVFVPGVLLWVPAFTCDDDVGPTAAAELPKIIN